MSQNLVGLKIRALRRRSGLTQGELARRAGISPSYLNLIELNKRAVGGALVDRIAAASSAAMRNCASSQTSTRLPPNPRSPAPPGIPVRQRNWSAAIQAGPTWC